MSLLRSITGIKPTGTPHLGNYVGAIRPAVEMAKTHDALYFVADGHALTSLHDGPRLRALTYEVVATLIACGLDPDKVTLFRQSDISATFELAYILACFTGKGRLNRAHAYKTVVQANRDAGRDDEVGVNMGLFTYPILMAADILLYGADVVPVGTDQSQHIEIAQQIAASVNYATGAADLLVVPKGIYDTQVPVTGLDGRKMSKSYDNTIELFASPKALRTKVMSITTDSKGVSDPKDPDTCHVMALYRLFADADDIATLEDQYRTGGTGYGHAKGLLLGAIEAQIGEMRHRYVEIIDDHEYLDLILATGATRARAQAQITLDRVKDAVGLS